MFTPLGQSHRIRGEALEFEPIIEVRHRRRILHHIEDLAIHSLLDSKSEVFSPRTNHSPTMTLTMQSLSPSSTSTKLSTSHVIGSMYSDNAPLASTTNPNKVSNKYGLFQFEVDADATPWQHQTGTSTWVCINTWESSLLPLRT
jgi:hypothetical protein